MKKTKIVARLQGKGGVLAPIMGTADLPHENTCKSQVSVVRSSGKLSQASL